MEVTKKGTMYWNMTPNNLVLYRRFGRKSYLHLQGRSLRKKQQSKLFLGLLFDPEDGDSLFLRNIGEIQTDYTAYSL
jgi:hypothetical protein